MAKQKIEIEVDIPDGYEATGELRKVESGDCFLSLGNPVQIWTGSTSVQRYLILRKKELKGVEYLKSLKVGTLFTVSGEGNQHFLKTHYGVVSEYTTLNDLFASPSPDAVRRVEENATPENTTILYTPED